MHRPPRLTWCRQPPCSSLSTSAELLQRAVLSNGRSRPRPSTCRPPRPRATPQPVQARASLGSVDASPARVYAVFLQRLRGAMKEIDSASVGRETTIDLRRDELLPGRRTVDGPPLLRSALLELCKGSDDSTLYLQSNSGSERQRETARRRTGRVSPSPAARSPSFPSLALSARSRDRWSPPSRVSRRSSWPSSSQPSRSSPWGCSPTAAC